MAEKKEYGFIVAIVKMFLTGPASILIIALAAFLGIMAVFVTPREEDPQIVVPMVDITVNFPGRSPEEVEQLVTVPLERLMWQIDGVEHVYSISRRDSAMVTVRFYVGQDRERAMVRLRDKIDSNLNIVPAGVSGWIIKPVEIDDVPIVTLTVFSEKRSSFELRRMAEEMKARLDGQRDISLTEILGGYRRQVLIETDVENMAARNISFSDIENALRRNNMSASAGTIVSGNKSSDLLIIPEIRSLDDVRNIIVSAGGNRIVRMEDIARITDGPQEQEYYVDIGFGPASPERGKFGNRRFPAVTMAFSKKKGTNAVSVAQNIITAAEKLKKTVLPSDVTMLVTRDYGKIADAKVNNLIASMVFGVITVVGLIAFTMGWREGLIVGLSVPISFALALFVNMVFGYTINRVTLFALILSLGLVVDDPITNVDNIQRHIRIGLLDPFRATLFAVNEMLGPVIMSTLTIIVSFIPMFFISGMMGPYMGPMSINVPLTVTFSTLCALTFVPWLSYNLLKSKAGHASAPEDVTPEWIRKFYSAVISPLLVRRNAYFLILTVFALLCFSVFLMLFKVPLKMLPFDNKDELQIILKMPEGSSLEKTSAAVKDIENYLGTVNEIRNYESYTGINAPIDFNGLVRHYGMRKQPNLADIRINLADKTERENQSHSVALRIRDELTRIAERHDAKISIVEVPPGPPVISTITVEVSGSPDKKYSDLIRGASELEKRMAETDSKHIVQIDDMSEAPHEKVVFRVNRDKAAMNGLTIAEITAFLSTAVKGNAAVLVHDERQREALYAVVRLPFKDRTDIERLGQLWIKTPEGKMVQLSELGTFSRQIEEQPIYHKNLERVVFVTAECAGIAPGEAIFKVWKTLKSKALPEGIIAEWAGEGEWEITVRVFRDLGTAFGVALIGIYLLLVLQTKSFFMPLIIMSAIPLTIIGIAPGFYLLNLIMGKDVAGYSDSIFFTATGMIGMIALGGIVIRNSIVLIEFIQDSMKKGNDIKDAIIKSGAVRFRPIMLTAATTLMGAWPITLDPVFSGLAWALIFGLIASTAFTMLVIPTLYMLLGPRNFSDEKQ